MKTKILTSIDKSEIESNIRRLIDDWQREGITSIETNFSTCSVGTKYNYHVLYSCLVVGT